MNHKMKIFYLIFLGILYFVSSYLFVNAHEEAHVQINEYHDIKTIEKKVSVFSGHVKWEDNNVNISKDVRLLHSMNEIVGYHISELNQTVATYLIFLIVILIIKE